MTWFLKLSNMIINTNYIHHIGIDCDKLVIHLMSNKFEGPAPLGIYCGIQPYNYELQLCKHKHFNDYKTVIDWIDNELK